MKNATKWFYSSCQWGLKLSNPSDPNIVIRCSFGAQREGTLQLRLPFRDPLEAYSILLRCRIDIFYDHFSTYYPMLYIPSTVQTFVPFYLLADWAIKVAQNFFAMLLKSIHYKRLAFWIFTSQKSNTFVEKIQNIIGIARIWTHDQQIRSPSC